MYVEDLTWPEIRDAIGAGKTTAIISVESTEQNGAHMALGKHNFIAYHAAGRIAETLGNALVYPILPFALAGDASEKTGHMRFPGTVSLSSEVFLGVVRQMAMSAIAAGYKNIFLMCDHGGGQAELKLDDEGLDAQWRGKGTRVFYVPDLYVRSGEQTNTYLTAHGIRTGGHAGASDTSQVLFLDNIRNGSAATSLRTGIPLRRQRWASTAIQRRRRPRWVKCSLATRSLTQWSKYGCFSASDGRSDRTRQEKQAPNPPLEPTASIRDI